MTRPMDEAITAGTLHDRPTTTPAAPAARKTPGDFQAQADAFNARTDEIAGFIVREHEMHKKLRDEEDERHAAQLQEYYGQQIDHALTRKTLIATAGSYGMTASFARALLRKG